MPWTVVRPDSHMRDLPRGTQVVDLEVDRYAYGAVTLCGPPFLTGSAPDRLSYSSEARQGLDVNSYNPYSETAAPAYLAELGLGCSLFARHYSGNESLFLPLLRCFSSRAYLFRDLMYSALE